MSADPKNGRRVLWRVSMFVGSTHSPAKDTIFFGRGTHWGETNNHLLANLWSFLLIQDKLEEVRKHKDIIHHAASLDTKEAPAVAPTWSGGRSVFPFPNLSGAIEG